MVHARCRCGYDTLTPLARFYANVDAFIQKPDDDGLIQPASRMSNTIPGIFLFLQGVLLTQHRIQGVFLESLAKYNNVEVQRNVEPTSITHKPSGAENQSTYPVTVRIAQVGTETSSYPVATPTSNGAIEVDGQNQKRKLNVIHEEPATKEVMKAKYVMAHIAGQDRRMRIEDTRFRNSYQESAASCNKYTARPALPEFCGHQPLRCTILALWRTAQSRRPLRRCVVRWWCLQDRSNSKGT